MTRGFGGNFQYVETQDGIQSSSVVDRLYDQLDNVGVDATIALRCSERDLEVTFEARVGGCSNG